MFDRETRERIERAGLDLGEVERLVEQRGRGSEFGIIARAEIDKELAADKANALAAKTNDGETTGPRGSDGPEIGGGNGVGSRAWRRDTGRSFSLSVRLDFNEIDLLRRRAAERDIGVSVLARSYIRAALGTTGVLIRD